MSKTSAPGSAPERSGKPPKKRKSGKSGKGEGRGGDGRGEGHGRGDGRGGGHGGDTVAAADVDGRFGGKQQQQQPQQQEQVIRLLVSRAASERQVSGRLTSQPDARGGRSGGDEGCGSMGGTMRAPRDAGETRRASLTSGAGSGTSSRGASGGAHASGKSGTSGGASSPGELLALGLYSVPEEKQTDFKSFLLSQTGHHRPGLLSDFGGIAGWVAANGAQRKASASTPKEKVMSHLPHHSPPAYRPS